MYLSAKWKTKSKKKLYDKYVPILTIINGHVVNHFSDKCVPLCYVSYFINDDERKLTAVYIFRTFYTLMD